MAPPSRVGAWLARAGLAAHAPALERLTEAEFCGLLMQDYPAHGVVDVNDKQRLYRLQKEVASEAATGAARAARDPPPPPRVSPASHAVHDVGDDDAAAHTTEAAAAAPPPPPPSAVPRIRVVVRKRPLNARERARGEADVLAADAGAATVTVADERTRVDGRVVVEEHAFAFDAVLGEAAADDDVFAATVAPLLPLLTEGGAGTVFAYGQTGSGKTHTMAPLPERAARAALAALAAGNAAAAPATPPRTLWASVYEVYGGKIHDLLNGRARLAARDDGRGRVVVAGLTCVPVRDAAAVADLAAAAAAERATGQTGANDASSRSHCVTEFSVREAAGAGGGRPPPPARRAPRASADGPAAAPPPPPALVGKLSFIDLAGSERGADTADADRETRMEGAAINRSLLALKECIRALDAGAPHVPFRGSKLTEVLRDSFVGPRARTVMVAALAPGSASVEHTLNTLRYADRVKELGRAPAAAAGDGGGAVAPSAASAAGGAAAPPRPRRRLSMVGAAGSGRAAPAGGGAARRASVGAPVRTAAAPPPQARPPRPPPPPPPPPPTSLLAAEDALIAAHRASVEAAMAGVRGEVTLLASVDARGAPVAPYAAALEAALTAREKEAAAVRAALEEYRRAAGK